MSSESNNDNRFWQINIGHILTISSTIATIGFMYGTLANKLEAQGNQIVDLQRQSTSSQSSIAALQISEAAHAQDQADLHKTIEEDFARRISKLEDHETK